MTPLSRPANLALFAAIAMLMVATRFHHFGSALHLPDASMALFFLGGLYLRRHWQFVVLLGFAVVIDWAAISLAGVSDFCVTPAYSFLLPAYAVLWYGGRLYAPRMQTSGIGLALALLVGFVCAVVSFAISNGAFYWLGGRVAAPEFAEYVVNAMKWGPMFVRSTMAYLTAAMALHALAAWSLRPRATDRGARA